MPVQHSEVLNNHMDNAETLAT